MRGARGREEEVQVKIKNAELLLCEKQKNKWRLSTTNLENLANSKQFWDVPFFVSSSLKDWSWTAMSITFLRLDFFK